MIIVNCIVCNKEIIKKRHESVKRYSGRKFCSQICSRGYMKEHKMGWFNPEIQQINRGDRKGSGSYYRDYWDTMQKHENSSTEATDN